MSNPYDQRQTTDRHPLRYHAVVIAFPLLLILLFVKVQILLLLLVVRVSKLWMNHHLVDDVDAYFD